jgi:hypothetical protein
MIDSEAASLRKYLYTGVNDYIYYKAFEYAVDKQCNVFDMGRSQLNSGTYRFKTSWGHCRVDKYEVASRDSMKSISKNKEKYKIFIILWKNCPTYLTNIAGPWVRKNMVMQ